tara:strand:- start:2601 stop:3113 length:513 start_codon:yes stop_codon:yes gene_type:complete
MAEERTYNKIQIVDEEDNILGAVSYDEAIAGGYIRRAARVFVFNESGQILIQRRSAHISKPLMLDQSAAGHVDEGETYREAALRELEEELGLSGFELVEVAASFRTKPFFNTIYKTTVPDEVKINFDPHEVHETLWLSVVELDALVSDPDSNCTDSLVDAWTKLKDKLLV